jgi:SAM-dependent methyltransferase
MEKIINEILSGYQKACILMTAGELDIFEPLADKPVTAKTAAERLKLSPKGVERLLNALCALGLAVRENEHYRLPDDAGKYLAKNGEHSLRQWIRLSADILPVWNRLGEFVRTGRHVKSIMELLRGDPRNMRAFTDAMHDKALRATWMLAREIPVGDYKRLLDVGGGPGTYALEWAKLHAHLRATVFDIPPVLEVTRDYIKRYNLQDRVDTKAGDFNKDDLGTGYDLVLLANVVHMYDAALGRALARKAIDALVPGGRIVIHGFCTDDEETGPPADVIFALNMGLLTEGGGAHPVREMTRWLREGGVSDIRRFRVDATPTGVVTGIKKPA